MMKKQLNIVNRDTYHVFQQSPQIRYPIKKKIVKVEYEHVDHDAVYESLKEKGLQIDITFPDIFDNKKKKPINGIFSPLFGSDATTDAPVYTCDCHKLTGGSNLGRICQDCGSPVRSIDADLRITGHIDIAPYHILSYHGYKALKRTLPKKEFNDIITAIKKIDKRGYIVDDGIDTLMDVYEKYDEVYYPLTGLKKQYAFMSKLPVYSARLRPLFQLRIRLDVLDVNKAYLAILQTREDLIASSHYNFKKGVSEQKMLNLIQQEMVKIYTIVENLVDHKEGVYRKLLASGRIDYTSRMVISLGTDLKPNEVDLPYTTVMTLYEEEIANYLTKLENISLSKAISLIEENLIHRDDKFVKIINQFLKSRYGVWGLINRNPTISESGILYCRVRKIHDDPSDMTLHLPPDILVLLGADFDGDQVLYGAVKDPIFHSLFMSMCPTYTFIDRATGRFNEAMGFNKDYAAIISAAWDIDAAYDSYLTHPEDDSLECLEALGLAVNRDTETRNEVIANIASLDKDHPLRQRFIDDFFDVP